MSVIAIDVGATKISAAIFSPDGEMFSFRKRLLNKRKGREVGVLITTILDGLLTMARRKKISIDSIGVCVPGIVNSKTGDAWAPNIPGWESFPLLRVLRKCVYDTSIDIFIESDRSCYLYGELWKGAAKGCHSAVFIAVGSGIGAGIMIDNRFLHGAGDIIGATGWMALKSPYKSEYKECGCFEYYASGNGIEARTKDLVRSKKDYRGILRQKPITRITAQDVFVALEENDPIAQQIINQAIKYWGMAAANIVSLLNPEKIVWGGGVFGPAAKLIPEIYKESCKWAQPIGIEQVEYVASQLSGNAGLVGAAYLAIKSKHDKDENL
ncbi:MAG: ROK family protein [Dysgonamonadaceae bacterium]|jgi:glucokinase